MGTMEKKMEATRICNIQGCIGVIWCCKGILKPPCSLLLSTNQFFP